MAEEEFTHVTPIIEKRRYRRVQIITRVRCKALNREEFLLTRDISVGGLFLTCQDPFPKESLVILTFYLRFGEAAINCRGKVAYCRAGDGMGIQFLDLSEEPRQAIQKFVDEVA
jgi:c-di-GMP-binding flagellar brake protein YcgR